MRMKKFFYVAIAAFALMVASCSQKTPAEKALDNYKACIEKIISFNGDEDELQAILEEAQGAEIEYTKYISEYSEETLGEVQNLSMKAASILLERAMQSIELSDEFEEMEDDVEEAIEDASDSE